MRAILLAALLCVSGAAWADDVPVPTENDGPAASDPGPGDTGCHRCVQGPDGGYSDSNYSNPKGNYYTSGGDLTCCAPGMSQDWAEGTGVYFDPGNAPHVSSRSKPGGNPDGAGGGHRNGGGTDR